MMLMVLLTQCKATPKPTGVPRQGAAAGAADATGVDSQAANPFQSSAPSNNTDTPAGGVPSGTEPGVNAQGADTTSSDTTEDLSKVPDEVKKEEPATTADVPPTTADVPPTEPPVVDPDPVVISTPEELKALCDTPALVKDFDLEEVFQEPPVSCSWGSDSKPFQGNLGKKDQRISARFEEWRALKLPKGALLCELTLTFKDAAGQADQQMRYDDEIFILFDDFILASSKDYNTRFGKRASVPIYNWANLVGAPYQSGGSLPIFCIDGSGTCAIPKTETKGILNLTVCKETTRKLAIESGIRFESQMSFADYPAGEHAIGMVTIGDNDSPQDCKHSPLRFRVQAKYVLP
jgi:hypothetical protein